MAMIGLKNETKMEPAHRAGLDGNLKPYRKSDIAIIKDWWNKRVNIDFNPDFLSNLGYIAYDNETPVAAAWLYVTNSPLAWLKWPISNPETTREQRKQALDLICDRIAQDARKMAFKMMLTGSYLKTLQNRFEDRGWVKTEDTTLYLLRMEE